MKLCLYGAGNTGKCFGDEAIHQYNGKYKDIYYVDSNEKSIGKKIGDYLVKDRDIIDDDTEVIITSSFWDEIYEYCCLNNYHVNGIYDKELDQVYTYKEMCKLKKCMYRNKQYIRYINERKKKDSEGVENFLRTGELFENISEVAIMLSNLCNYAALHKLCPANCVQEKEIMPSKLVYKILDELKDANFDGTICFHIYNEPLIDPRLFLFIQYIKQNIVEAKVEVYSNGYYLNEQMVVELQNIGVDILIVTGYGEKEYYRLIELPIQMAYCVLYGDLDRRIDIYDYRDSAMSSDSCRTFFTQIPIYVNGDIGICCLDYRHLYGLANIWNTSLRTSLNSAKIVHAQKELLFGNRNQFSICKNCSWR